MATLKEPPVWLIAMAAVLLLPASAWAQRMGGHRGGGFRGGFSGGHIGGFRGGFGGGRFGGFTGHGGVRPGFLGHGGFRSGFFGFQRGSYRPYYGYRHFYGYPRIGFYGSLGYGYWPYGDYWPSTVYYSAPSYIYSYPSYPVVVERDVIRYREADPDDYGDAPRSAIRAASPEPNWLIAFRDTSIRAVTDYWLEGSTLHYVGREGTKSSAELSAVDISFSKDLNRERGLEFRLPSPGGYQPRRRDSFGRLQ